MIKSRLLRITLYAALIFLAGAMTGALVAPHFGRTLMRPPDSKQMSQHMLDRFQSGLNLTADQLAKIEPLVEKTGADLEKLRHETSQRVHERVAQTNEQISLLLTVEQKAKFIKMEAEHRKKIARCRSWAEPPESPKPSP